MVLSPPHETSAPPALEVRDLVASRPGGFSLRVDALEVRAGDAVAICGPSGAGKSSLLDALVGHLRPDDPLHADGDVAVLGAPWPRPGTEAWRDRLRGPVCTVPQDARGALDPLRPLGAQVADLAGVGASAVRAALGTLGLDDPAAIMARRPHQVSGGQAQRALLAVPLLRAARLCLLDEPSAGLDRPRVDDLVRALAALRQGPAATALVVATHDRALVAALGAVPFRLVDGELSQGLDAEPEWPRAARVGADAPVVAACRGLGVRIGRAFVVERCDLELRRGENVALLGPSGAGKTTVGRALAGHVRAARGAIVRPARPFAVQMLFQDAGGSLTPGRTVRALCAETADAEFDPVAEAERLGLDPALLDRPAERLSGGERRRAALLRALAARPEVLVLDEPTQALDRASAIRVVETLLDVRARTGAAMLWITHQDDLAHAVADRVVPIDGGRT